MSNVFLLRLAADRVLPHAFQQINSVVVIIKIHWQLVVNVYSPVKLWCSWRTALS